MIKHNVIQRYRVNLWSNVFLIKEKTKSFSQYWFLLMILHSTQSVGCISFLVYFPQILLRKFRIRHFFGFVGFSSQIVKYVLHKFTNTLFYLLKCLCFNPVQNYSKAKVLKRRTLFVVDLANEDELLQMKTNDFQ